MARFTALPDGYAPDLILNLRQAQEGGDLLIPGDIIGKAGAFTRRECLVLVHGFNNHAGEAAIAYLGFRRSECGRFEDLSPKALEKLLGDTFWPGDAQWPGLLDRVDFIVYPAAVGTAKTAGPALGDLIRQFPMLERVHFIGHSLGCRVVLETVLALHEQNYPLIKIGGICLMAAAVPTGMVEEEGRFASLLDNLGAAGTKLLILHSTADTVLHFAFPPGQSASGQGEGWFPTALGRFGPPHGMRGIVYQMTIEGAGHSDYWGHNTSEAAKSSTAAVGDFFKLGERPRKMLHREFNVAREVGLPRAV